MPSPPNTPLTAVRRGALVPLDKTCTSDLAQLLVHRSRPRYTTTGPHLEAFILDDGNHWTTMNPLKTEKSMQRINDNTKAIHLQDFSCKRQKCIL